MAHASSSILVGVEFDRPSILQSRLTRGSERAFERGLEWARPSGRGLVVAHVYVATDSHGATKTHTAQSSELGRIQRVLDGLRERAHAVGVVASAEVLWGEPVAEFARMMDEGGAEQAAFGCSQEIADAVRARLTGGVSTRGDSNRRVQIEFVPDSD